MRFHVGSDHGGVQLRRRLAAALRTWGHDVASESGPGDAAQSVDYPDVAHDVAHRVVDDPGSFGLLVCGTGQGMAMSANKVRGIRAGVASDPFSARMLREHNDANVVCFGERVVGAELAEVLLREFVGASFGGGRHERRVARIERPETEQ